MVLSELLSCLNATNEKLKTFQELVDRLETKVRAYKLQAEQADQRAITNLNKVGRAKIKFYWLYVLNKVNQT